MSKTKSLKQKTTGFDIMYRVITAIMAIMIYPLFYFVDFFMLEIRHTDISDLLGYFSEAGNKTLHTTYEKISLYELPGLIDTFSGFANDDFDFKTSILQNALYRPVVVAAVLVAIALVLGLVVLGFAIFSNKKKVIAAISGTGFLFTLASYISFTGFFAEKVVDGEITLAQLFNVDGIILSTILPYLGEVSTFTLCGGFFAVMFLLLGICLWSASVMIVDASEEKEKQLKAAAKKKS